jgi:four helix bundle protein
MKEKIQSHCDLRVYQKAFGAAMEIFDLSKTFPKEETYSLTDQIRRSSRSVCSNLAEAWRKRRYEAAFVSKLSDSEGEAAETQVWLDFAAKCQYLQCGRAEDLRATYEDVVRTLVGMITHPETWIIGGQGR